MDTQALSIQQTDSVTVSGVEFNENSLFYSGGGGGASALRDSTIGLTSITFREHQRWPWGALFAVESTAELTGVTSVPTSLWPRWRMVPGQRRGCLRRLRVVAKYQQ